MGGLKKNIFWIGLAVVVVGALGFWAVTVLAKQGATSRLAADYEQSLKQLEEYTSKDKKVLKTPADIKAMEQRTAALTDMESRIQELLAGKKDAAGKYVTTGMNLNTDPGRFNPKPDKTDVAKFRQWIDEKYKSLCNVGTMICRISSSREHGQSELADIKPENIETVIKQFLISQEIHRILSSVKVRVQSVETDTETRIDKIREDDRGVQFLDRIEFLTENEMQAKRMRSGSSGTTGMQGQQAAPQEPYQKQLFELEFVAHYSVVPEVIRRLTATREFFLVVTRMDIRRQSQLFGKDVRSSFGPKRAVALTGEERMLKNTRDNEAPVVVVLECQALEFDFKTEAK